MATPTPFIEAWPGPSLGSFAHRQDKWKINKLLWPGLDGVRPLCNSKTSLHILVRRPTVGRCPARWSRPDPKADRGRRNLLRVAPSGLELHAARVVVAAARTPPLLNF